MWADIRGTSATLSSERAGIRAKELDWYFFRSKWEKSSRDQIGIDRGWCLRNWGGDLVGGLFSATQDECDATESEEGCG
ncbi:hypothetical protein [Rubritalea tangerina]|uniref:hypothetical protein n=1 Tax=Rubritalea tangerina TaxID=430798 RepID=UPI00361E6AD0